VIQWLPTIAFPPPRGGRMRGGAPVREALAAAVGEHVVNQRCVVAYDQRDGRGTVWSPKALKNTVKLIFFETFKFRHHFLKIKIEITA